MNTNEPVRVLRDKEAQREAVAMYRRAEKVAARLMRLERGRPLRHAYARRLHQNIRLAASRNEAGSEPDKWERS